MNLSVTCTVCIWPDLDYKCSKATVTKIARFLAPEQQADAVHGNITLLFIHKDRVLVLQRLPQGQADRE